MTNYNAINVGLMHKMWVVVFALISLNAVPAVSQESKFDFDLLFRGGLVLDGTGNPAKRADVGINGDTIGAVGNLSRSTAMHVIDVTGMYVAPGFIDMHSHADTALVGSSVERRRAPNLVGQGITTVVFGADGRNARWPIATEISACETPGVALNVVPMVGHGTVRGRVLGDDFRRRATDEEIAEMKRLVREAMEQGAWGMGAGLEYDPGRWSTPEEVIELAKVVGDFDGFYYAHQRSQSRLPRWQLPSMVSGPTLDGVDGLLETISIAREAGIRVVGSHIKAKGRASWGRSYLDTRLVDEAREKGLQVYLDQYPYDTFNGSAGPIFPGWALSGGTEELQKRLDDPETRQRLENDLEHMIDIHGGPGRLIITDHTDPTLIGKTVQEVAKERGSEIKETLIGFALNGSQRIRAGHLVRPMGLSEADVVQYLRQHYTATCTDAGVTTSARKQPGQHPRFQGTYPRKIARYVRDQGVISLPFAIRSMTSLGAQIIGLTDRGMIHPGYKADITVFDYTEIRDRATVMEPWRPNEGIYYVMANGKLLMDNQELTGELAGVVLKRGSAAQK